MASEGEAFGKENGIKFFGENFAKWSEFLPKTVCNSVLYLCICVSETSKFMFTVHLLLR